MLLVAPVRRGSDGNAGVEKAMATHFGALAWKVP